MLAGMWCSASMCSIMPLVSEPRQSGNGNGVTLSCDEHIGAPFKEPLFPSCERGFHPGIYEGISESDALSQVGLNVTHAPWPFLYSRPRPDDFRIFPKAKKSRKPHKLP